MDKLPLRLRILQEISNSKAGHNVQTIMKALKNEYGNERQFHESACLDHLLSLKASGLLTEAKVFLDQNSNLLINYTASDAGKEALRKYLPKK